MTAEIQVESVSFDNLDKFLEATISDLRIYTERTRGVKSDLISIELKQDHTKNTEDDPWISCDLNRNQALQLKKVLEAFIEESEID